LREAQLQKQNAQRFGQVSQVWSFATQNSMFKNGTEAVFEQRKRLQWKYFLRSKKIGTESAVCRRQMRPYAWLAADASFMVEE
jgi:hypothetical protein